MQNLKRNPQKLVMDLSNCNQKQILEVLKMFNRIKSTISKNGFNLEVKTQKNEEESRKKPLKT